MLIIHISLASISIGMLIFRPRARRSAAVVAAAAVIDLGLGSRGSAAITVVGPLIGFLTAALTLSAVVADSGLLARAAARLARAGRGNALTLYLLVCVSTAVTTVVVSLDGAVVVMVPVVLALQRRYGAPLAPNLFGVVAVANTASIALPQGNPTNLVVIGDLHLSATSFSAHMLIPGALAAALCVVILAVAERRALADRYRVPTSTNGPLTGAQRRTAVALTAAAAATWVAPLAGIPPWWPFIGVVTVATVATRSLDRVNVPWRIAIQIAGLVIVVEALGLAPPVTHGLSLPILLAVALGTGAVAAAINNLPASVWVTTLLSAGPVAYGASIGLAVGALAAPQGSVATLIAADIAGDQAPAMTARRLAPLAIIATIAATILLDLLI